MSEGGSRRRAEALPRVAQRRLWQAGLTPYRARNDDGHVLLRIEEHPRWRLRCHQSQSWHLWALYEEASAENPDPSGYVTLITVDRRNDSEVATFRWGLLAAWLRGESPLIWPRRRPRVGFAHHRLLEEAAPDPGAIPLLVSRQVGRPVLLSLPLATFKSWMSAFPPPETEPEPDGEQLSLALWGGPH